jgi:hypothetical protein
MTHSEVTSFLKGYYHPSVIYITEVLLQTKIVICPYVQHHLEKYWKDPEAFIPERWDEELTAANQFAYMPFNCKCCSVCYRTFSEFCFSGIQAVHWQQVCNDGNEDSASHATQRLLIEAITTRYHTVIEY